ncbi:MAG: hypothetical protein H6822_06680 [Planctomycetaceae bacterium]|nr:hypothetical protein [Planctomycetales bacterium]MCB9921847.1 hypothetical protein [Planctomycetaceae bacterium]
MNKLVPILAALLLLPVATYCVFGFIATFEPTDRPEVFMAFRIGYGVVGGGCLIGLAFVITQLLGSLER